MGSELTTNYLQWSPEKLVDRVTTLEKQLQELQQRYCAPSSTTVLSSTATQRITSSKKKGGKKQFDPSKHSTRFIALKFAYLGQKYNGFEYTKNTTPLPTIEEVLWRALIKTKLIFPTGSSFSEDEDVNWEGCEYSKCGRTDRGVSAFGQVIGLRVRSNRPLLKEGSNSGDSRHDDTTEKPSSTTPTLAEDGALESDESLDSTSGFIPIRDEIQYPQMLNRILPPEIRVLAWCPSPPPNFSARFSCRERRYRYFFTQPAFTPTPGNSPKQLSAVGTHAAEGVRREGWLEIDSMKDAVKRYEGLHDFRNLCKVDGGKQIEDFSRRIFLSEIQEVPPDQLPGAYVKQSQFSESISVSKDESSPTLAPNEYPKLYCFVLHGSAFLWHQVRHMVAVLFLVGQGLESPDVVDKLLDIQQNPQKPMYNMADDAPLVLWDCIFPDENSGSREDALDWIYAGDVGSGKFGIGGVVDDLWANWRQKKIEEVLAGSLLNLAAMQGKAAQQHGHFSLGLPTIRQGDPKLFLGGNGSVAKGQYVPMLKRKRMDTVETINKRYATKKQIDTRKGKSKDRWNGTRDDHVTESG